MKIWLRILEEGKSDGDCTFGSFRLSVFLAALEELHVILKVNLLQTAVHIDLVQTIIANSFVEHKFENRETSSISFNAQFCQTNSMQDAKLKIIL